MRKLMWFTIGFAAVCGLCAYGVIGNWIIPWGSAALVFLGGLLAVGKWKPARIVPIVALGAMAALLWFSAYQKYYLLPAAAMDGVELETTVTASDYSYSTGYGTAVDGAVTIENKRYQIRIYMEEDTRIAPGDEISGIFRFRTTTPGGEEESAYHQGKGIFLLGYSSGIPRILKAVETAIYEYPAILAEKIKGILADVFLEDVFPFVKALLLGDSYDLSYETDISFKLSGIRHIIAVSGLHVSILYSLIAMLTGRRRFLTALMGLPALLLFAAVAGFTPSVTRACIMVGLMMLATAFGRQYDSATALSFACLVMLFGNPLSITSVSFQLSVGCVAGILLFNAPIHNWLKGKFPKKGRLQNWFCTGVSVTLSSMTLVTPLSAFYFGTVSLVSVVTNLLTLWVVNGVFTGIVLVCLLSLLSMNLAAFLAAVLAWPIRYVLMVAKLLGSLPLAAVYTRSIYIVAWLAFCYCLLVLFLFQKNRKPALLGCCAALGLCAALLASWLEPLTDDTRITMLDVGQGQSILLQSEGKTFLVDCGGDSDTETADIIAETLLSQGVSSLDGIILTHYDRDHAGALENLLTRIDTDVLILPGTPDAAEPAGTNCEILYIWDPVQISFGSGSITVYGPIFHGSSNENSLCVLFDTEKCDILITGDRSDFGERMLMRKSQLPDVDVLVAGHHGAGNSTSEELLRTCTPETVLISVGEDNFYGHPAPELLERLAEFGCSVYRTDRNGTILFRR